MMQQANAEAGARRVARCCLSNHPPPALHPRGTPPHQAARGGAQAQQHARQQREHRGQQAGREQDSRQRVQQVDCARQAAGQEWERVAVAAVSRRRRRRGGGVVGSLARCQCTCSSMWYLDPAASPSHGQRCSLKRLGRGGGLLPSSCALHGCRGSSLVSGDDRFCAGRLLHEPGVRRGAQEHPWSLPPTTSCCWRCPDRNNGKQSAFDRDDAMLESPNAARPSCSLSC